MRVRIDAADDAVVARVRQLLQFSLAGNSVSITDARVSIETVTDHLGRGLSRCRAEARLRTGDRVVVEEVQSSLELAVTRAMERSRRAVRRRLARDRLPHPA